VQAKGRVFCIPVPLGPEQAVSDVLAAKQIEQVRHIRHFVVEHPKTARLFLKQFGLNTPLQELNMVTFGEHERAKREVVAAALAPALAGQDVGLLSEAGCPGVADPGAEVVEAAHRAGLQVVPLVGPSSLLLALMASGFNGQQFAFLGYLNSRPADRQVQLRALEKRSAEHRETLLFIETPYRAQAVLDDCIKTLRPATRLLVARDLTLPTEQVYQKPVNQWRHQPVDLGKALVVFGLAAS
jgi:16S rRNA (cytidine1402-2'-O)-methyltransferase